MDKATHVLQLAFSAFIETQPGPIRFLLEAVAEDIARLRHIEAVAVSVALDARRGVALDAGHPTWRDILTAAGQ